jgi:predicted ATP-dependent serine protease
MLELGMQDLENTVFQIKKRINMTTYECSKCGMSVNATCGKCNAPLVNDMLKLDDGNEVQISKCPNDHGKIKSPLCCGQDMSCKV